MTIRHRILLAVAAALVLASCAGTETDGIEDAAPVADSDVSDPVAEDADTDDDHDASSDDHDESVNDDHDESGEDAHDEASDDGTQNDEASGDDQVDRVVEIDMEDIAFSVEELEFAVGERVRFEFVNVGAAPHEALIGDMHVQEEHEQEMADGGGHDDGGHHGDLSMISLESGESGSFVHEFTEAGELWMGCHVPGHWGAGMKTKITVTG